MSNLRIILKNFTFLSTLYEENEIVEALFERLPIYAGFRTWGDELYFSLDLGIPLRNPVRRVNLGDIAYSEFWKAFCIFYGPTPFSSEFEIIPNGPVEIIGKLDESPSLLKQKLSGFFRGLARRASYRIRLLQGFSERITLERVRSACGGYRTSFTEDPRQEV